MPVAGTGSVAERLAHAVAATVGAAGLLPSPVIAVRKRPLVLQQDGASPTQPVCVVCVRLAKTELVWAGKVLRTYLVGVYVAVPTTGELAKTAAGNQWAEQVGAAVHGEGTFSGVPETNEVIPTDRLPFDASSLDKQFNWTTAGFQIETLEDRSTPSA